MRMLATATLALALLFAGGAQAASREDVARVVDFVHDESIPVLSRTTGTSGGQIVFIEGGVRYTIYHSGERIVANDPDSAWISFWTRPDGTHGRSDMVTFSDSAFDGDIDLGINGNSTVRHFSSGEEPYTQARGPEWREYWQREYDNAIAAAIRYIERHR